jgi:hypothetical protein
MGPFIQKWIDKGVRVKMLFRNNSRIRSCLRRAEINGMLICAFGGRFIDILALDAQRCFVVIELKVSRGYDRVIGQLLRYMAWIEKHHAEPGQRVRGIIATREISEDLKLACAYLPNVSLYEYELSVSLQKVVVDVIAKG